MQVQPKCKNMFFQVKVYNQSAMSFNNNSEFCCMIFEQVHINFADIYKQNNLRIMQNCQI